jgi:peptidoglycan/xylan/chitin deacetylase (PgdA/CDA1 family)
MLHTLKRVLERAAVLSGVARVKRLANRARALVLMYHNVVPDRRAVEGDRSLHLPHAEFARQLDFLQTVCDVVPLEALVDGPREDSRRCRVAITFDDAYLGALSLGVDELVRRGLPGTVFVPPGLLGEQTWWDVLGAATADGLSAERRAELLERFQGRTDAIRTSPQWSAARLPSSLRPELRIAAATEVARAAEQPGIAVGSHTWSHPNLAAIDPELLDSELRRPLHWLRERYSSFVPYLTYPYGLSSASVEQAASRIGYRAAFLAGGGWFPRDPTSRLFALPRFDVSSGLSLDGLRLRFAGIGLG